MKEKCSIKLVEKEDYNNVINFLYREDKKNRDLSFWNERINLWWESNPFFKKECKRGYILVDQKNKIRGFFGLIVFDYVYKKNKYSCYSHTNIVVDINFRHESLRLIQSVFLNKNIDIQFNGTPNKNVQKILKYNKFYNTKINIKTYIFFKYYDDYLQLILEKKINFLIKFLLLLLGLIQTFMSRVLIKFIVKNLILINESSNFNNLIFENKFLESNRKEILKWFLKSSRINSKKIFLIQNKNKEISGSIIFKEIIKKGTKIYRCIDIWANNHKDEKNLIQRSIKILSDEKSIIYFDNENNLYAKHLKNIGIFINFFKPRPLYIISRQAEIIEAYKSSKSKLDLSQIYSDYNF